MCWSSFTLPSSSVDGHEHLAEGPRVDEPEIPALLEGDDHVGVRCEGDPARSLG